MAERGCSVVCPMPGIRLDQRHVFEPGFEFIPLTADGRRALLDAGKRTRDCSPEVLETLIAAEVIVCHASPSSNKVHVRLYSMMLEEMLRRIMQCLFLLEEWPFASIPPVPCYFLVHGQGTTVDIRSADALRCDWTPSTLTDRIWIADSSTPLESSSMFAELQSLWARLRPLVNLSQIIDLSNPDREARYTAAGNERIKREAVALSQSLWEERLANDDSAVKEGHTTQVPSSMAAPWFIAGYVDAFLREFADANKKWRADDAKIHLRRAWRIFVDSAQLDDPHRFVSMVTALEALLSTSPSELRYQLATRVAWILHPSDSTSPSHLPPEARRQLRASIRTSTFDQVSDLYHLRSKIVHGGRFTYDEVDESSERLRDLVREVFVTIIRTESLYNLFTGPENGLSRFLKYMHLSE